MTTTQYVQRKSDIEEQNTINDDNLEVAMPISIRQPNPQLVPIRPPSLKPESSRPRVSKIMRHANFSTVPPRSNLTKLQNSGFQGEFSRVTTGSYVKLETKNFSHGVSQITSGTVTAAIPPATIPTVAPSVISPMTQATAPTITATIKGFSAEKTVEIANNNPKIKNSVYSKVIKPSLESADNADESAVESKIVAIGVSKEEIKKKMMLENGVENLSNDEKEPEVQKKRFACPICNRFFARKFNMQTHQTTHEVDRVKPFVCNYPDCDHSFTRKHDLKRHIYGIHELPEQEFKCSNCSKTFARKDACKRHSHTCRVVEEVPENQDQDSGPPKKRAKTKINNRKKPNIKNIGESVNESTQDEQAKSTADNHEGKHTADILDKLDTLENKSIFSNMPTDITLLDQCTVSDIVKRSTDGIIENSTLDIDDSLTSSTIEAVDDVMNKKMPEESISQTYEETCENTYN